ncbi:hypothetical protein L596_005051 [Steinernema carpocapsae]|uniref:Homeobox domain-containing protein n=1 Tax=Steinernema carpocapsae TaxID=34508 RepID=A0A4U8UXP9_STECR|nr:hypothetical protein L596_005051 [Steinernema carpocapsae]
MSKKPSEEQKSSLKHLRDVILRELSHLQNGDEPSSSPERQALAEEDSFRAQSQERNPNEKERVSPDSSGFQSPASGLDREVLAAPGTGQNESQAATVSGTNSTLLQSEEKQMTPKAPDKAASVTRQQQPDLSRQQPSARTRSEDVPMIPNNISDGRSLPEGSRQGVLPPQTHFSAPTRPLQGPLQEASIQKQSHCLPRPNVLQHQQLQFQAAQRHFPAPKIAVNQRQPIQQRQPIEQQNVNLGQQPMPMMFYYTSHQGQQYVAPVQQQQQPQSQIDPRHFTAPAPTDALNQRQPMVQPGQTQYLQPNFAATHQHQQLQSQPDPRQFAVPTAVPNQVQPSQQLNVQPQAVSPALSLLQELRDNPHLLEQFRVLFTPPVPMIPMGPYNEEMGISVIPVPAQSNDSEPKIENSDNYNEEKTSAPPKNYQAKVPDSASETPNQNQAVDASAKKSASTWKVESGTQSELERSDFIGSTRETDPLINEQVLQVLEEAWRKRQESDLVAMKKLAEELNLPQVRLEKWLQHKRHADLKRRADDAKEVPAKKSPKNCELSRKAEKQQKAGSKTHKTR